MKISIDAILAFLSSPGNLHIMGRDLDEAKVTHTPTGIEFLYDPVEGLHGVRLRGFLVEFEDDRKNPVKTGAATVKYCEIVKQYIAESNAQERFYAKQTLAEIAKSFPIQQ